MINAGMLSERITIAARDAGKDAAGQPVNTWTTVATVWADVRYPSGLSEIRNGADRETLKASIRIRYRADLNAGMRVTHRGRVLDIRAVAPNHAENYVDLICEAVS